MKLSALLLVSFMLQLFIPRERANGMLLQSTSLQPVTSLTALSWFTSKSIRSQKWILKYKLTRRIHLENHF